MIVEHPTQYLPQQAWSRRHGPERTASLSEGDIERMQKRSRARFPDDRGGTPDVIGVTVSKNQMP
jgi:hypothetical protein